MTHSPEPTPPGSGGESLSPEVQANGTLALRPAPNGLRFLTKGGTLILALIVVVVAYFWLGSRYPAIDEKAAMAGDTLLEDVLSFEAKLPVQESDPLWRRVAYSTVNWSYTNKEGMTFGVVLATLILTFLRLTPRRVSHNVFLNTVKGTLIGAPLGVCVNCAAPIGKGMYQGGAPMETSLATLLSSPTLNIIVLAMTFSLFPLEMAVTKIAVTLVLVLVLLPPLVAFVFRPERRLSPAGVGLASAAEAALPPETWPQALKRTGVELAKSFWFILTRTVPLMLLAGFLGVLVATFVPLESLSDWAVSPLSMLVVAVVGTFLPVPIAFDVVLVQALMLAGLRSEFAMVLLATLGSFSIYPFFILWNTMPKRVAVVLFLTIASLGVAAGYFVQGYERYDLARSNALLQTRFGAQSDRDAPAAHTASAAEVSASTAPIAAPGRNTGAVLFEAGGVRVEAAELQPRTALPPGNLPFTRLEGSDLGIDYDRVMTLDFMMPFSHGRGIASGDFDNDGWADLALASSQGVRLYRNLGTGAFSPVPVPQAAHLNVRMVALIDIDNDGWQDLFLGAFGDNDYFLLNDRQGFAEARLIEIPHQGALFTEAASFFDIDKDADLDFVKGHWFFLLPRTLPSERAANYLVWNRDLTFEQEALDEIVGETLTALISDFNGDGEADLVIGNDFQEPDIYYEGEGNGRFRQLSAGGPIPVSTLATMSVDTGDINNDLVPDIYLTGKTNDFTTRRNAARGGGEDIQTRRLQIRQKNADFEAQYCRDVVNPTDRERCQLFLTKREIVRKRKLEGCEVLSSPAEVDECMVSLQLLQAQTKRDQALCALIPPDFPDQRAMCDAYVAYHEKGEKKPRVYKYLDQGAIAQAMQGNVLLVGSRDGHFTEAARDKGVYDGLWSWNAKFADLDNDQWQDLYVVNGWWLESRAYSSKFFKNREGQGFVASEKDFGLDNNLKQTSYTYIDLDNDGDLDLVTRAMHGYVNAYVNNEHHNNLITFEFRDGMGNSFGIGNKVYIHYGAEGEHHQFREIKAGSGYLSFDAPYAHFGLGPYDRVNKVEIVWSTGERTVIDQPFEANKKYVISRKAG